MTEGISEPDGGQSRESRAGESGRSGPDGTHPRTIDWDRFWKEATGDRRLSAQPGVVGKADLLARFFERVGTPTDLASVGCGPATVLFDLAEEFPEIDLVGYDAAESILAQNRARTSEDGQDIRFERAVLPEFDPGRTFDIVYCYATMHYVGDPERAVRNLYAAVADGGYLVVNYPNRLTPVEFRRIMDDEVESPLEVDPEAFAERFRLVLDRENLLSYERIYDLLGSWPRSYWSAVDAPDERWTGPSNPCVYVPK